MQKWTAFQNNGTEGMVAWSLILVYRDVQLRRGYRGI